MKLMPVSHTSDWTHNWNGSIAIKLTAIILWSVMVTAFIMTAPFMLKHEGNILKDYLWNNQQLINKVELSLNTNQSKSQIKNQLKEIIDNSNIEYVSIHNKNIDISYGIDSDKNFQFPASYLINDANQKTVINIQHHPLKRILIIDRVILGSSIIIGAILFGSFIFIVTNNVVHNPIRHIVGQTHKITRGDKDARFDEIRDDEFGELARFSNQMLDNLERQRIKLSDANKELVSEIQNREEALAAASKKAPFWPI